MLFLMFLSYPKQSVQRYIVKRVRLILFFGWIYAMRFQPLFIIKQSARLFSFRINEAAYVMLKQIGGFAEHFGAFLASLFVATSR